MIVGAARPFILGVRLVVPRHPSPHFFFARFTPGALPFAGGTLPSGDPALPLQWHLSADASAVASVDINVHPAWTDFNVTGMCMQVVPGVEPACGVAGRIGNDRNQLHTNR